MQCQTIHYVTLCYKHGQHIWAWNVTLKSVTNTLFTAWDLLRFEVRFEASMHGRSATYEFGLSSIDLHVLRIQLTMNIALNMHAVIVVAFAISCTCR